MNTVQLGRNHAIFEKSCAVIPGGVNSPVRAFIGLNINPLIVKKGRGDTIWDEEGNSYIDFCMSWGALLHGHAFPVVTQKVKDQVDQGSSFGIATAVEEEMAREIVDLIPAIDQVRFVSSGTEATMTALRLARAYTARPLIVKFNGHYHGHADPFLVQGGSGISQIGQQSSSKGVPYDTIKHTLSLPFNDVKKVKELFQNPRYLNQIAAVIVEPIAANMGLVPASEDFLTLLFEETRKVQSLLIFDEVISGFRVGLSGAQGLYNIEPDLSCFGKIVGGGFPAAVFGGRKEVMDQLAPLGEVYQAGTLSGNPVAMQAGLATLNLAKEKGFYEKLEAKTRLITKPVQIALKKRDLDACLQETVGMFTLFWGVREVRSFEDLKELNQDEFKRFFKFLLDRGIYFSPSPYEACFISMAHTEENLIKTRDTLLEYIQKI